MDLDKMDKDGLRTYVDYMLRILRLCDAFWYIFVEEEQGSETADHFNERVWHRVSSISARDIREMFKIAEKGLEGFEKALRYFPWCIIVGYEFERRPDELIISVRECPTQKARIVRNLGEYACKEMHRGEFVNFAREIDPGIVVECLHAPLDPHPPERICQWRFTMDTGAVER